MSNESIERFDLTVLESSVKHVNPDGKLMYVTDHERIVKELEARMVSIIQRFEREYQDLTDGQFGSVEDFPEVKALRDAISAGKDPHGLSDAIKEVEKMRDDQQEIVNIACVGVTKETITFQKATILLTDAAQLLALDNMLARLKSLSTQREEGK